MNAGQVIGLIIVGLILLGIVTYFTLFLADAFGMGIVWFVLILFLVLCVFVPWLLLGLFIAMGFAAFMAQGFQ